VIIPARRSTTLDYSSVTAEDVRVGLMAIASFLALRAGEGSVLDDQTRQPNDAREGSKQR
jgi:hypothetical protein